MKRCIYTLSALALATSLSFAQDKPAADKPAGDKPAAPEKGRFNPEDAFKKLDTNSDGSLTLDEFKASPRFAKDASKAEEAFKKLDTNADGKLSLDEFKAGRGSPGPGGGGRGCRGGDKRGATPPAPGPSPK